MNKQNGRTMKYFQLLLLFFLSIAMISCSKDNRKNHDEVISPDSIYQEIGNTQVIKEFNGITKISVYYPKIGDEVVDQKIMEYVNSIVTDFKNEVMLKQEQGEIAFDYTPRLAVQYENYASYPNIYSIKFRILEGMPWEEKKRDFVQTLCFQVEEGKNLRLEDIIATSFQQDFYDQVIHQLKTKEIYGKYLDEDMIQNLVMNAVQNGLQFTLTQDKITVYFPKYDLLSGLSLSPTTSIAITAISKNLCLDEQGKLLLGRKIDPDKPMIALTFDDGPHDIYTVRILDALKKYGGKATFFVLGQRVDNHSKVLNRMIKEGSEIGNHSYSHPLLTTSTVEKIKREIAKTQEAIIRCTGYTPKLVRPTYGAVNQTVRSAIHYPMIEWSVDTEDWKSRNVDMIVKEAMKGAKDGAIILMHDVYPTTATAAEKVIQKLTKEGYQLVTISELFEYRGTGLNAGKEYFSSKYSK
nr:polysaccharide deacetylase family protein [uncultured Lachnoclostridium sp.]